MTSPDGRRWIVRRLWLPRLRREERGDGGRDGDDDGDDGGGFFDLGALDDLGGLILAAVAVLVIALVVVFLLPFVLFVLELLVVPLVVGWKVVRRRPFTVEALPLGARDERLRWHVVGWRASGEAVREIAAGLERGETAPAPVGVTRVV